MLNMLYKLDMEQANNLHVHCTKSITMYLVVKQDSASRFNEVFVDKREHVDIILWSNWGWHNCMVIINYLLQSTHCHGCAAKIIDFGSFFLHSISRTYMNHKHAAVSCYSRMCLCTSFLCSWGLRCSILRINSSSINRKSFILSVFKSFKRHLVCGVTVQHKQALDVIHSTTWNYMYCK